MHQGFGILEKQKGLLQTTSSELEPEISQIKDTNNMNVIKAENLGKKYIISHQQRSSKHTNLREVISEKIGNLSRKLFNTDARIGTSYSAHEEFWALRNVSFEIKQGDRVGIIGRNGAGKTTLLKILSRITEPTTGRVSIKGRIASLLEVGTGFHPELTGRENIYLNGAILGMAKTEIKKKFDEIVAFAEVEKFLDTPVKRYSSGMYVRLAFAVAAHLEPEILLVDEVLAVGDVQFQKKCLGKMGDIAKEGRTVLFVSHNMAAVQNLCGQVILLSQGDIGYLGSTNEGIQKYMEYATISHGGDVDLSVHPMRRVGCLPLLNRIRMLDHKDVIRERFLCGEQMKIEFTFDPIIPLSCPQFGIGVDDWMGVRVFSLATYLSNSQLPPLKKACKIICSVEELPLSPGRYTLSLSAGVIGNTLIDALDHAVSFEVEGSDFYGNGSICSGSLGKVLVRSRWEKLDQ